MNVIIIPCTELNPRQIEYLSQRVAAAEHACDNGPLKAWDNPGYKRTLYAILVVSDPLPIGILYANLLESELDVGWWIDSKWRGKKVGRPAVVEFAKRLRSTYPHFDGSIRAPIKTYAGRYDQESRHLLAAFEQAFSEKTL